jgi:uncharacterized membrane protein (GlpM family)
MFYIRFVIGGLIIALEPVLAKHIGGKLAGLVLVFPTLITLALISIGQADGPSLLKQTDSGALWGIPALVVFLLAVYFFSQIFKQSYLIWIGGGVVAWLIVALIILKLEH